MTAPILPPPPIDKVLNVPMGDSLLPPPLLNNNPNE